MKNKRDLRVLEQKSFRCQIPELSSSRRILRHFSQKSLNSSEGYFAGSQKILTTSRDFNKTSRVPHGPQRIRSSIKAKSSQKLLTEPHITGLFRFDSSTPTTQNNVAVEENFEQNIMLLMNKLKDIESLHQNEVRTLRLIISGLKKKYNSNPNQSFREIQTSRQKIQNKDMINEISRLRKENQKLLSQRSQLIQQLNQQEKTRIMEKEILNMEVSRLHMEISSLKIQLLKVHNKDHPPEFQTPPKLFHIFSFPQYDHTKNEMPERISEIQSKFERSHVCIDEKVDGEYFTKSEKRIPAKMTFPNSQSTVKTRKLQNAGEVLSSNDSNQASELSFLAIDSKQMETSK